MLLCPLGAVGGMIELLLQSGSAWLFGHIDRSALQFMNAVAPPQEALHIAAHRDICSPVVALTSNENGHGRISSQEVYETPMFFFTIPYSIPT